MERFEFKATINAPKERVWEVLWGEKTYPVWTEPFGEGSSVETDWTKGSRAIFLDGRGCGMVARITDNIPYKYLAIEHLGQINNGVEDFTSDGVKEWAGACEDYTLTQTGNQTTLLVHMDTIPKFMDFFKSTWPPAMEKIKELAELT